MEFWGVPCKICGEHAFLLVGAKPNGKETASFDRFVHVDGTPWKPGEPMACDNCHGSLHQAGVQPSDKWQQVHAFQTKAVVGDLEPKPAEVTYYHARTRRAGDGIWAHAHFGNQSDPTDIEAVIAVCLALRDRQMTEATEPHPMEAH